MFDRTSGGFVGRQHDRIADAIGNPLFFSVPGRPRWAGGSDPGNVSAECDRYPKSDAEHRKISLGSRVAGGVMGASRVVELSGGRRLRVQPPAHRTAFSMPTATETLSTLRTRGIEGYARPSHDLRHSSITNAASAGTAPKALMSRAEGARLTQRRALYRPCWRGFGEEADRLEDRLWGASGTKSRYHEADSLPAEEATEAADPLGISGGAGI
jgi:hypothetical protein